MPHTLLLADDSVTIQRVIELTFADEDVRVVAVGDGDQAIASVDQSPPDIVLADVGMPGRSGYEVAQHIRSTPRLAHIPVLLLTGAFEPIDQNRAREVGCDGVLAKPFEPQMVIGRVKELLAGSKKDAAESAGSASQLHASQSHVAQRQVAEPHAAQPFSGAGINAASDPFASPSAAQPQSGDEVSDYFERLDQAFTSLAPAPTEPVSGTAAMDWFGTAAAAPPADLPLSYGSPQSAFEIVPTAHEAPVPSAFEAPRHEESPAAYASAADAFAPEAFAAPPAEERTVIASPPPVEEPYAHRADRGTAVERSIAVEEPVAPPMPTAPPTPAVSARFPALEDAFQALLAAEATSPAPLAAPAWPAVPPAPAAPALDTDLIVEQVTRRVLESMSDRVVRETVSQMVSEIAERLIREEIERIKARIK